jgi:protein-arginine kinase activator protein McsA
MKEEMTQYEKLVKALIDKMMDKLLNEKDFKSRIARTKNNDTLKEVLYLMVSYDEFEKAIIVRDEMIKRGLDTHENSKFAEAQQKIDDWFISQL